MKNKIDTIFRDSEMALNIPPTRALTIIRVEFVPSASALSISIENTFIFLVEGRRVVMEGVPTSPSGALGTWEAAVRRRHGLRNTSAHGRGVPARPRRRCAPRRNARRGREVDHAVSV